MPRGKLHSRGALSLDVFRLVLVVVVVEVRPTALVVAEEVPVVLGLLMVLVDCACTTLKNERDDQEEHDAAYHQGDDALTRAKQPAEEPSDCTHVTPPCENSAFLAHKYILDRL